jgi:hypothetical protein
LPFKKLKLQISKKNKGVITNSHLALPSNLYLQSRGGSDKRNSTYTKELIAHRFERKNSATRLTKWVYGAVGLLILGCLTFFLFIK